MSAGAQQEIFQSKGLGEVCGIRALQSIKISSKASEKAVPQGTILEIFLLYIHKSTFLMENLTQRWTQSRPFLQKPGYFFWFSKRHYPSSVPVSVAQYASIFLNMPKYPWKCLNKLFWLCQASEYAWSSYMFDRAFEDASGSK